MRGVVVSASTCPACGQPSEGEGAAEQAHGVPSCPRGAAHARSRVEQERAGRLRQVTAGG